MLVIFFGYMSAVAFVQLGSMHQTSAALGIPMFYIYLAPLLGFALTTIRCAQSVIIAFSGFNRNHKCDIVINTKPELDETEEGSAE